MDTVTQNLISKRKCPNNIGGAEPEICGGKLIIDRRTGLYECVKCSATWGKSQKTKNKNSFNNISNIYNEEEIEKIIKILQKDKLNNVAFQIQSLLDNKRQKERELFRANENIRRRNTLVIKAMKGRY